MVATVSLEGFVAALRAIPEEEFTNRRVLETVTNSRVPITELDPYLVWKPDRYTRSLIYRNEVFEVIVLCWNVGQGSPVHDHAGQRCWMTLPQGRLEITNYSYKDGREIEFIDADGRKVSLHPRNTEKNEDEAGEPNVRDGGTNYFIYPSKEGEDASWLKGKAFQSIVIVRFSLDGKESVSEEFILKPHVH